MLVRAGMPSWRAPTCWRPASPTWQDFLWSLDATAHVDPSCFAWALRKMEGAWPEQHLAKLSVNTVIGLWARNVGLVYLMRTSNNQLDGHGCQYRQTFVDGRGRQDALGTHLREALLMYTCCCCCPVGLRWLLAASPKKGAYVSDSCCWCDTCLGIQTFDCFFGFASF